MTDDLSDENLFLLSQLHYSFYWCLFHGCILLQASGVGVGGLLKLQYNFFFFWSQKINTFLDLLQI